MPLNHSALLRAVTDRVQSPSQTRQALAPDYGYASHPSKLSQTFVAIKKFSVGSLAFQKDEMLYIRYTGSGGIYDIISETNAQERVGPDEMQGLIQEGKIIPHLL